MFLWRTACLVEKDLRWIRIEKISDLILPRVNTTFIVYRHVSVIFLTKETHSPPFCFYKVILLLNNFCISNNFQHKYAIYLYLQDINLFYYPLLFHGQTDFTANCQTDVLLIYISMLLFYSSFTYNMIEKSCFTIHWKITYELHKYSMSPSTSRQDTGINVSFFVHFYITIK